MFCNTKKPIISAIRRRRIPQFCILNFNFYTLKLAIGQFEYPNKPPPPCKEPLPAPIFILRFTAADYGGANKKNADYPPVSSTFSPAACLPP